MQDDDFIVVRPCNALSLFFDYAVFQFIACDVVYLPEEFVCHVLGNACAADLMGEIATRLS